MHLELLSVKLLLVCTIKVYLLGHSIWNHLARTCKEWLRYIWLIWLHTVEVQSLWGRLHHFICMFVDFDFWVRNECVVLLLIFHGIIALSSRVARDMKIEVITEVMWLSGTFSCLRLWIELHFIVLLFTSTCYDKATFWTLVVAIEVRRIGLRVQFTSVWSNSVRFWSI